MKMYRCSTLLVFLFTFLCLSAVYSGAPIDTSVRHNGNDHGSDTAAPSQTAEKPPKKHSEEDTAHSGSDVPKKPESDEPSEDDTDTQEGENPPHGEPGHDHSAHSDEKPGPSSEATESESSDEENLAEEEIDQMEASPEAESGVCVAANMLDKFEAHELVFERHFLARVLCDVAGSCATKGHIVSFNGKGMMMGSYCEIVGCKETVMAVNSPKYSRGLKVESNSEGMHFTAFAAKYETRSEEALLSAAVRLGL